MQQTELTFFLNELKCGKTLGDNEGYYLLGLDAV
jgi:hypothetical protein